MLRIIAAVLIVLAAVAAVGPAHVQALVAFVLFAELASLAVAHHRAAAERRSAADAACCAPLIDDCVCSRVTLHSSATAERMAALLRALEDRAARADEAERKP